LGLTKLMDGFYCIFFSLVLYLLVQVSKKMQCVIYYLLR